MQFGNLHERMKYLMGKEKGSVQFSLFLYLQALVPDRG